MSIDATAARTDAAVDENPLEQLGEQVRAQRALHGMSRKEVCDQAEVSERHLAMIEKGEGNVSIKLLTRIAAALNVPAGDLVSPPHPHNTLVHKLLNDLSPEDFEAAYRLLRERFHTAGTGVISLVGLRGAGKTTLGQRLAKDLDVPFLRVSAQIEDLAGIPMGELQELTGQAGYRRLEEQAVAQILTQHEAAVVEAGGSIVANSQAYDRLLRDSWVIWIQAAPAEHMQRVLDQGDLRPMGGREDAMDDLVAMLNERSGLYAQAHTSLDTSRKAVDATFTELSGMVADFKNKQAKQKGKHGHTS